MRVRCYEIGRDDNFVTTEVGRHVSWVTGGNIVLGGSKSMLFLVASGTAVILEPTDDS